MFKQIAVRLKSFPIFPTSLLLLPLRLLLNSEPSHLILAFLLIPPLTVERPIQKFTVCFGPAGRLQLTWVGCLNLLGRPSQEFVERQRWTNQKTDFQTLDKTEKVNFQNQRYTSQKVQIPQETNQSNTSEKDRGSRCTRLISCSKRYEQQKQQPQQNQVLFVKVH